MKELNELIKKHDLSGNMVFRSMAIGLRQLYKETEALLDTELTGFQKAEISNMKERITSALDEVHKQLQG